MTNSHDATVSHDAAAAATEPNFATVRAAMRVTDKWSYLDHAAVAPLPESTGQAIATLIREVVSEGDTKWPSWARRNEAIRSTAAAMMGAQTGEIAFIANTSTGIGFVAEGMDFRDGDNIVTLANEFPSNQYPWMNLAVHGVETRTVPVDHGVVDLDRVADACDERTRLVSLSWVGYSSGYRIDVKEAAKVAHDQGALFFLDAIQGLAVYPLDVRESDVDFLAADGHKWMLGPEGAGLFYVKHELLSQLRPIGVGWNSVKKRSDYSQVKYDLRDDAARYEGGSPNMMGIHGLGASLDLLTGTGVTPQRSPVADRVLQIADYAATRVQAVGGTLLSPHRRGHRSGIVTVTADGLNIDEFKCKCVDARIAVSARGGGIRLSPHCYNNYDDIDQFVDLLDETITSGR
jgi:cysteine desulfurase/selenocysteine lyase